MQRTPLRTKLPSFRDRLPLGSAGLRVSPFCLGMVRDPRVVREAFDRGINFFFLTADMHWPLYDGMRTGLRDLFAARPSVRDEVVVAVVSYAAQPEFAMMPFLETIEATPGLKHVDVTVAGGVKEWDATRLGAFAAHPSNGQIPGVRATGASFHERVAAAKRASSGGLDIAFIRYNADHRGAESDLFPHLDAARDTLVFNFKSVLGYVPESRYTALGFEPDAWRPRVPDHYRFVLANPELDGILCSPGTPSELLDLEQTLAQGALSRDEISYMKCVSDLDRGRARRKIVEARAS